MPKSLAGTVEDGDRDAPAIPTDEMKVDEHVRDGPSVQIFIYSVRQILVICLGEIEEVLMGGHSLEAIARQKKRKTGECSEKDKSDVFLCTFFHIS